LKAENDLSRAHEGYGSESGGFRKMWRVEFVFEKSDLPSAPGAFRAVGYGHGAATWQAIIHAYIENEDSILTGEVGVERAA
jgi:hypothetical protein